MQSAELKNLSKYSNLRTLKFAGNLIKEYAELAVLVSVDEVVLTLLL
jgi:acidic leucine-rich nuclear phosphoprotein 32 family member B